MPLRTAVITHLACLDHLTGDGHPERPERLRAVLHALEDEAFSGLIREQAPEATMEQLTRVHPASYVNEILSIKPGPGKLIDLDPSTVVSDGSAEAALRAAGAAVMAVDAVMEGWARAAFAATRPPGHHAEPSTPGGFCLFSNAAIAAAHARAHWNVKRIAIADFDVHHGQGTQACLEKDPDYFYGSSHQYPLYPGTGFPTERGVAGNVVNVMLQPGTTSEEFREAWAGTILPAIDNFRPDLLIVSAGFDAHRADPLAHIRLDVADFVWITQELLGIADRHTGGKIVSLLEGGYDLDALARSVAAHVRTLMRA
ncbi:histone deacetylase family protein [Microvirga massiliensis]|uniref:histone deacetylase family protein n=1 Tax=Microvirga massiliensis TaxID=1033741 RepID=UPI00062B64BB